MITWTINQKNPREIWVVSVQKVIKILVLNNEEKIAIKYIERISDFDKGPNGHYYPKTNLIDISHVYLYIFIYS